MGVALNIGVDFDGVIGDSHFLKPQLAKQMFGVDIPGRDFRRSLVVDNGLLTEVQYAAVGQEVFSGRHPIFPVAGSLMYLRLLMQHGHSLKVVTSRSGETLEPAQNCLKEWKIDDIPVIGVGYGVSKLEFCRDFHVYVDDDLSKLTPLIGVVSHLLFFSRPENEHEEAPKEVLRIASWYEIYQYIWEEVRI